MPSKSALRLILASMSLCGIAIKAQTAAPAVKSETSAPSSTAFDVASIREHQGGDGSMSWRTTDDGFTAVNMNLRGMLGSAYKVKLDLISGGPGWIDNKGFDIEAKVLPSDNGVAVKLDETQHNVLLRAMLIERFHLKAHIETKTLPVYDLVVAKGGFKIQPDKPIPPSPDDKPGENKNGGSLMTNGTHMEVKLFEISGLAQQLGYIVQRTVIDKTGITGQYTFNLDWAPENQTCGDQASSGAEPHPPIYTALQDQLGLKLVPAKGPVDTLVVDHIELPTAN